MPAKATSSFVRTLNGARPTARTRGLSARASTPHAGYGGGRAYRAERGHRPLLRIATVAGAPRGARDQPFAVDPLHLLVGSHDRDHLACLDVDVVALEVEGSLVPVDGDPDLVRRSVRDPVVLRLERARLVREEVADLRRSRVRRGADGECRVGCPDRHHQVDVVCRRGLVPRLLDLVDREAGSPSCCVSSSWRGLVPEPPQPASARASAKARYRQMCFMSLVLLSSCPVDRRQLAVPPPAP